MGVRRAGAVARTRRTLAVAGAVSTCLAVSGCGGVVSVGDPVPAGSGASVPVGKPAARAPAGQSFCGVDVRETFTDELGLGADPQLKASDWVGLTLEEAERLAARDGAVLEMVRRAGECMGYDLTNISNHVKVSVSYDGVVDAASIG
ncbi:hypothetical protein [Aeromicrobium sp.]|uniref:hypothetical protein n=1 Tax=Aeromicrobium sp. TaxID=1871063 RepID=UPI0019A66047|nr:hypothetical protein [Aeromicrobium sp.]MBC7633573.1 hypothetical protein [Aeromicrobium sp.]